MITAEIRRSSADQAIASFRIHGHAGYAKRGQDIVCAGVSAVTVGTVNAIERLLGIALPAKMKDGWLDASVPADIPAEQAPQVQLLLEAMADMLRSIEESYGTYIRVEEFVE